MNKKRTSLHWVKRKTGEDLYSGKTKVGSITYVMSVGMKATEAEFMLPADKGIPRRRVFAEKKTAMEYIEKVFCNWLEETGLKFKD